MAAKPLYQVVLTVEAPTGGEVAARNFIQHIIGVATLSGLVDLRTWAAYELLAPSGIRMLGSAEDGGAAPPPQRDPALVFGKKKRGK